MEAAESSAGWMQELAKAAEGGPGHTPETEEYNISSMVFRSHERPFHPGRLATVLAGVGDYASTMTTADSTAAPTVFAGVVRAKGHLWLATANARPIDLHVAGRHVQLGASVVPFLAAMPREEWEERRSTSITDLCSVSLTVLGVFCLNFACCWSALQAATAKESW